MKTASERIVELMAWLQQMSEEGMCPALINDDNGHWAITSEGMQNVPEGDGPQDISTTFFVEADKWKDSILEALEAAYAEYSNRED